jgi:hypothetical protein
MSRRGALQLRYQIVDEPSDPWFARFAISPMFLLLPLTVYGALEWSVLFWLLPGVNGLVVAGRHKWRDLGLSVLALVLFFAGLIAMAELRAAGALAGLARGYATDVVLALAVFPLIRVMMDQHGTIELRRALRH